MNELRIEYVDKYLKEFQKLQQKRKESDDDDDDNEDVTQLFSVPNILTDMIKLVIIIYV